MNLLSTVKCTIASWFLPKETKAQEAKYLLTIIPVVTRMLTDGVEPHCSLRVEKPDGKLRRIIVESPRYDFCVEEKAVDGDARICISRLEDAVSGRNLLPPGGPYFPRWSSLQYALSELFCLVG